MKNQEVSEAIKVKTAILRKEMARIPDARVLYKWFINGELSKSDAEEVVPESVDSFIDY